MQPVKRAISLAVATVVAVPLAFSAAFSVAATNATPTYDVETNDDGSQIFTQSIAASLDGSVYVVGGFNSYDASPNPAVFGSTSLYNAGGTDYEGYVAKIGPDGVWDWAFRAGSTASGEDRVVDVVALDDGGAIVLIDASYDMTVSPVTGSGEFSIAGDTSVLVRVAADGSFVWNQEMTGSIPVSQELSLSADQQTVVALAANNANKNVYVEAFNTDTGASIWDRVIQKGTGEFGSTAWEHMELAVNNAGTVVVSFSYYGGSYILDYVSYDSTSMGNSATGAWHSMFAAFDITDGSTDWVASTRMNASNGSTHAEAQMFELEPAGDKFLAVTLVEPVNGTVNFISGGGAVDLQYWGDNRYVVAELSDSGNWVEKTQLPACDGFGCTLDNNYMNLHAADDGSFDLWYFTDQYHSSIAWMDYLHPDDHMVVASFNADGTGEKLTSFTGGNGHRPGYQNAIDSFHDGSLVIAGTLISNLTDGAGNTVSGLPSRVFIAPLDNGPWAYNTPTPPSYTITYGANGGTGAPADQTCVAGSTVTLSMTEPTRAGYRFTSWTTGGMFPPSIAPGSTRSCADTYLYAQWEESVDADGDGLDSTVDPDDNNPDIDGDGVLDGAEQDASCITSTDCDSDGLADAVDADDLDSDQDDDSVLDGAEEDSSCVTVADCDSDGLTDDLDVDDLDSDQDDDSVLDGAEEDSSCVAVADCDEDGLADAVDADDLDSDQDDDSVLDGAEEDSSCVTKADCDDDGLADAVDADDLDSDQDDDSVLDGAEEDSSCVTKADCDEDGLADAVDADDLDSDQDDDSVLDGAEEDSSCVTKADCDDDGLADAVDADDLDSDQDDDSVLDGAEDDSSCVTKTDCDEDGLADALDTDDLDSDQDNDGVLDGAENDGCVTDPDADCGTVTTTTVPGDNSTTTTTTTTSVPESSTTTTSTPATTETSIAPDTTGGDSTTTTVPATSTGETTTTVVLEATIGESTTTSEPLTLPATGGDNRVMPAVILLMCVGAGLVLVRRRHAFID